MGGQGSLEGILIVGGAELRWPLSKVRRGHRLDDFSSPTTRFVPVDQTAGVPVTRRARGPLGTVPRATSCIDLELGALY